MILPQMFDKFKTAPNPQEAVRIGDALLVYCYALHDEKPSPEIQTILTPFITEVETALGLLGENVGEVKKIYEATFKPQIVGGKKSVDYNGMMLWRDPTAIESLINLKAIGDAFDSSEEKLKADIEALKNKLVADAVAGIIQLDPADYHTLVLEPDPKDLAKFRDDLQAIYDKGRALVVDELEQQGATDVDTEFDIDPEDDQSLDNVAAATTSKLTNDVQSRVIGIAATLVALGIAGSLLKDKIFQALSKLSDAYIGAGAATASHVSLNIGRDATAHHNASIIKEVYYSSVLDQNTCVPCQDADGTTAETEADLPDAPNPDCEGWGRCRCIHVFVYDGEQGKGNENSGNYGHEGRPGQVGGSKPAETSRLHPGKLWFHGTPTKNLESIFAQGLLKDAQGLETTTGNEKADVYLTPDPYLAKIVAATASIMHDDGKFAILEVDPKGITGYPDPDAPTGVIASSTVTPDQIVDYKQFKVKDDVLAKVKQAAEGHDWDWSQFFQTLGKVIDGQFATDISRAIVAVTKPKRTPRAKKDMTKKLYSFVYGDAVDRLQEFLGEQKGGEGSGNFNHEGRPGMIGGSGPGGTASTSNQPANIDPQTLIVYHGTQDELLTSIKEKGLIPGGGGMTWRTSESRYYVGDRAVSVFMTKNKNEAMQYAEHAAFVHNDYYETVAHPLLLKITIPKEFQNKIVTEPDNPNIVRLDTTVPPEWITPVEASSKAMTNSVYAVILYDGEKKGGEGSGNYGHEGRPGLVGGSGPGGGTVTVPAKPGIISSQPPTPAAPATAAQSTGLVPGDAEKFHALKDRWAVVNNQLLAYVDDPKNPQAQALVNEQKQIVKDMYMLQADPGGLPGIGLPGGPRDVAIVGAGPGGLAASVMGGTDGLDTLLIDANTQVGGQAKFSSRIENFTGFPIGVTGDRLAQNMFEQAQRVGADTKLGVRVTGIDYDPKTGMKTLTLSNGEKVDARAVIIAGGVEFRKMDFPGAESRSVIYADAKSLAEASKGKPVVVVGGSNGAAQAALGAAQTASFVTVLSRSEIAKGMSDYQVSALHNNPKIHVIEGDEVSKLILGTDGLARQLVTKKGQTIDAAAVGIFIGGGSNVKWLPKSINIQQGKIATDSNLETSMPGVFAVGDIRHGSIGRIGAAVGEGQLASRNLLDYFTRMGGQSKP